MVAVRADHRAISVDETCFCCLPFPIDFENNPFCVRISANIPIPGDIDVSVIPGVWCCVSYPLVTSWDMCVKAIGETGVIHIYQFISF